MVIFCMESREFLKQYEYDKIDQICQENRIFAGISNNFNSLSKIFFYYKQALRAIELGIYKQQNPGLFIYSNYSLTHVNHIFLQKEQADIYMHPKLKQLLDYDLEHKTELAYSLYMYLLHERNISVTAKEMNIHRNTLVYRIKKVDSLIEIDYNESKERQYYILSYELYKLSCDCE